MNIYEIVGYEKSLDGRDTHGHAIWNYRENKWQREMGDGTGTTFETREAAEAELQFAERDPQPGWVVEIKAIECDDDEDEEGEEGDA